jgi:signal transduction histidine kinase
MRLRRDSLIFKIVSYNGIAIVLSTIFTALLVIFITFKEIDDRFVINVNEKILLLEKMYDDTLKNLRNDVIHIGRGLNVQNYLKLDRTLNHQNIAATMKEELDKTNFKSYYDVVISIVSKEGEILGEAGSVRALELFSVVRDKSLMKNLKRKDSALIEEYSGTYRNEVYTRIIIPYIFNSYRRYIVITLPLNLVLLQDIKNFLGLEPSDRIFLLANDRYSTGDLNYPIGKLFFSTTLYDELKLREYKYYDKKKTINGLPYMVGIFNLQSYNRELVGSIGVAVSRVSIENTYVITIILIVFLLTFFIFLSTTTFKKITEKLMKPLQNIDDAANKISMGDYQNEIPVTGSGELRTLSLSFNKMLQEINLSHEQLKTQNLYLLENLNKIEAIEKILIGVHIEENIFKGVKTLLNAFTSEVGLGFSRAMFFRYSREADALIGDTTAINKRLIRSRGNNPDEKGFKFQVDELDELVKLIKIPLKEDNLFSKALKERRIIFYNDKGYKYNLGNDLFNGFGLSNFLIFPVLGVERNYGVIIIDYFNEHKQITKEEFELLNLLLMNLSIRIKNKIEEENKLDHERIFTMEKVIERILQGREEIMDKLLELLEKGQCGYNITEEFIELEEKLKKIKERNTILRTYSLSKGEGTQEILLDKFMATIIEKYKKRLEDVQISLFFNASIYIYGDPERIRKLFEELLTNAINAVNKSKRKNKKINIIIAKEKNIDKVKVTIKDNGIGMTETQLNTIYNPFSNYNEEGPGLGLSFVYSVIRELGGVIKFFSTPEHGTEVKLTLNVYKEE